MNEANRIMPTEELKEFTEALAAELKKEKDFSEGINTAATSV
jgi:hypothetical protein